MISTTFTSVANLAKFLKKYAAAMDVAFDTNLISNDMKYHVKEQQSYAKSMRVDGRFSYRSTIFVRSRGVEGSHQRVQDLNDFVVSIINIHFDASKGVYSVEVQ